MMTKILEKFFYVSLLLVVSLTQACKKLTVQNITLGVTANTATVKAGTPLTFNFTGDADDITFFSGETAKIYANVNRVTAVGTPNMEFTLTHTTGTDQSSLSLLVSTNFDGVYDSTDVKSAMWTDITSRAILATNSTATVSGVINLSDFLAANTPVYVAFRCASKTSAWTITNYNNSMFNNVVTSDNSIQSIADVSSASWVNVNFYNPLIGWKPTTTSLPIATSSTLASVNWAISKALPLNRAIPDVGTEIKTVSQLLAPYTYTYATPGTYTATFLANNATTDASNNSTVTVTVTVTP